MNAELLTAHRVIAALECATGGSVQPTRVRALSAVIIEELAATAGGAPDDLIRSLLQNPQEPSSRRMISAAMVNETHFWRIPSHFEALRDDVFPRLAHEHPDRKIRVWSAACSIGPEAWSVAMAAVDAAVLHRPGVEILATDLDDSALELARAGRCGRWAQRGLLPEHADRWIQYDGEQATVSHQLTDLITFRNHNLLSPSPAGPFDVILCRNVLIYLSPASRRLVFANLMAVLAPDGVLLVAPAELEHTSVHGFAINA
ncbi:MAG: chemotaxis protein methyltransferase CheR, partial [Glaciecola sp.]